MSARPPPLHLVRSAWLPYIRAFVSRLLRSIPHEAARRITVTSWYRDPRANQLARGEVESQHLFALAADLAGPTDELRWIQTLARAHGLVAVLEPGHLHVQLFPKGALARVGVVFPIAA